MRKAQKQEILNFIDSLHQAHGEIREALRQKNYNSAQNMLSECQEFATVLGENIEKLEGEGHITVSYVEEYCETLFHVFQDLRNQQVNENKEYKILRKQLLKVENSVKNDIAVRKEIAFFPYKASMWDSLESVYLAAKEDPECDAYCVPIPYYDLNPDHSFGQMHYEGKEYPEDIEITDWTAYNLEERKPDVIYIHNPYDEWNHVTSVHPRYYSSNLKKYTDTLVYIPYYSTSGGMSEAQSLCPAYLYADYIVIQSPKFREYFDKSIPDRKFLPFGSPKFDRVIRKCQNPPEPPAEWREKMKGRKVYFYNTSITGMLADTESFLKKVKYVFDCFQGREDACLLWRPHPLLEATFDSMRPEYRPVYDKLKQMFIDYDLGVYDDTPDVTDSVALSDVYVGDAGSSVTSLFGIAGKPVFILNNKIHREPEEDSWRGEVNTGNVLEKNRFAIIQCNKLYISEPYQYRYRYFCDLKGCTYGDYYSVYEINDKKYACPLNEQAVLVIGEEGVEKKVELKKDGSTAGNFCAAWKYKKDLVLLPLKYPAIVCFDTVTGEVRYFRDKIEIFTKGGECNIETNAWIAEGVLYIASPSNNLVYKLHIESGESEIIALSIQSRCGCSVMMEYRDEMWLLPYIGRAIVRWNPRTGETREYLDYPADFRCLNLLCEKEERLFGLPAFYGDYMYLPPRCANMYLKLNLNTGECIQWYPSFENDGEKRETSADLRNSVFLPKGQDETGSIFRIYSGLRQKLYSIDLETNAYKEIAIEFDVEELKRHEPGFGKYSDRLRYACLENSFNSLGNFLAGKISGSQFDKDRQLAVYREVMANADGRCGKKVHDFVIKQN